MTDGELRAYVLTAVASHASKELRRRSRKPAGPIESTHEQVISDVHVPLPDEAAIGAESAGVARDLLAALPPRRRAVMLLRYGWGLSPAEVCALVAGLSRRAYRKEVTRGVEQLIESLRQVESGEWCRSREPLLRDYIAGIASDDERRQVEHHLSHCRACSTFAARLSGHLHDASAGIALASIAGLLGAGGFGLTAKLLGAAGTAKLALSGAVERVENAASGLIPTMSGNATALGAGVAAKVAAGGGGKAIVACLGTGAAATACVAAGVMPGIGGTTNEDDRPRLPQPPPPRVQTAKEFIPSLDHEQASRSVVHVGNSMAAAETAEPAAPAKPSQAAPIESSEAASQSVSPEELAAEEFDPLAGAAPATPATEVQPPQPGPAPNGSPNGSGAASIAGDEFGP